MFFPLLACRPCPPPAAEPEPGFDPSDYGTVILWLDAGEGTFVERSSPATPSASDGDPVGTWQDQSGEDDHAAAPGDGNRPVLKLNQVNGLPAVRLDGVDDTLSLAAGISTARTVFVVVRSRLADTAPDIRFLFGGAASFDWHGDGASGGAVYTGVLDEFASGDITGGGGWVDGIATAPLSMVKSTSWGLLTFRTTGGVKIDTISSDRGNAARSWDGDYAEILVYSDALADEDREAVEAYLLDKYGL